MSSSGVVLAGAPGLGLIPNSTSVSVVPGNSKRPILDPAPISGSTVSGWNKLPSIVMYKISLFVEARDRISIENVCRSSRMNNTENDQLWAYYMRRDYAYEWRECENLETGKNKINYLLSRHLELLIQSNKQSKILSTSTLNFAKYLARYSPQFGDLVNRMFPEPVPVPILTDRILPDPTPAPSFTDRALNVITRCFTCCCSAPAPISAQPPVSSFVPNPISAQPPVPSSDPTPIQDLSSTKKQYGGSLLLGHVLSSIKRVRNTRIDLHEDDLFILIALRVSNMSLFTGNRQSPEVREYIAIECAKRKDFRYLEQLISELYHREDKRAHTAFIARHSKKGDSELAPVLYYLSLELGDTRRYEEAERLLLKAIGLYKDKDKDGDINHAPIDVIQHLGHIQFSLGKYLEAYPLYLQVVRIKPEYMERSTFVEELTQIKMYVAKEKESQGQIVQANNLYHEVWDSYKHGSKDLEERSCYFLIRYAQLALSLKKHEDLTHAYNILFQKTFVFIESNPYLLNEREVSNMLECALIQSRLGNHQVAEELCIKTIKICENDHREIESYNAEKLARIKFNVSNYVEAEKWFDRTILDYRDLMLNNGKHWFGILMEYTYCKFQLNKLDEAENVFQHTIHRFGRVPLVLIEYACFKCTIGEYPAADILFNEVIEIYRTSKPVIDFMDYLYFGSIQKNVIAAERLYDLILNKYDIVVIPPKILIEHARIKSKLGKFEKANWLIDQAIKKHGTCVPEEVMIESIRAKYNLEQYEEANRLCEPLIFKRRIDTVSADVLITYARIQFCLGSSRAEEFGDRAIDKYGTDAPSDALMDVARIKCGLKKYGDASRLCDRAVEKYKADRINVPDHIKEEIANMKAAALENMSSSSSSSSSKDHASIVIV